MQQLPSDLSDLVIDHLATETAALKACGLACKQLFPRSRFHLFSELKLQVGSALKNKGSVDVDTMDEFMDLMDSSPSNILTTVRRLQLSYGDERSIPKAHLLRFPSCPQLLDLSIGLPRNSSEDVIEAIREQLAVVGGKFPSLSSLAFRFHHSSIRAAALFDVVACFPTLENLSLGGDDVVTDGTRSLGLFPARLNTIDMHILRGAELLFEHLSSLPVFPLLRRMGLNNDAMELHGDTPIILYLKRAGHALHEFDVAIWGDGDSFEKLALQYCTNLQHISIKSYNLHPYTYLVELLPSAASNDLITIDIACFINNMGIELEEEDGTVARALDEILADTRFRNLQRFSVTDVGDRESLFTPELRARMPLSSSRGILQDTVPIATPRFQSARVTMND
ncbi:hypothetical protein B0H11DRAFT_2197461 [Mycena galericulata]|nr:hypothetical protein B0H11DRAFT_2197461 [Mycena galericulata]